MIMLCVFCSANFEFSAIKYNTVVDFYNKTVSMFFVLLINGINILRRIIEGLFK